MSNLDTQHSAPPAIRARHRFGYRGNMFMLYLGRRIPAVGYFAVSVVSLGFWLVNKPARRASMAFLARVKNISGPLALMLHSYRQMRVFGILILDRSVALSSQDAGIVVQSDHRDRLKRALELDRGLLILTAHFGALEIAAPWLKTYVAPDKMHFVMYRDFSDSTEHFHRDQWRMLEGIHFINSTDPIAAGLQIMAALRRRHCVGMRADRIMGGRTVQVTLLGQNACLPAGPFTAAVAGHAAVVTAFTLRQGPRRYRMFVSEPRCYDAQTGASREELIQQAANDYAADLESLLREYPYQWGNFYDFWATAPVIPETSSTNRDATTPPT
jgi:predicted LPLAT superfamily acyltransferase